MLINQFQVVEDETHSVSEAGLVAGGGAAGGAEVDQRRTNISVAYFPITSM